MPHHVSPAFFSVFFVMFGNYSSCLMMPQEAEFNILRSRLALGLPPLHQLILNKQIANIQRREEVHGPPMSFTPLGPLGSGSHAFHCVPLPLCHAPAFRPFFARFFVGNTCSLHVVRHRGCAVRHRGVATTGKDRAVLPVAEVSHAVPIGCTCFV